MKTKPKAMPTKRKAAATPSKGRGRKATMSPSADVTMLDKCGRVTFERLRREHADPADRFMDASGKPFTKAVAMPDGRTVYRRPDNVWDAVRDWIDEQISWAHTNIVDGMRLWREVEHAHIVAMREPHTSTNVEILIAECVKAFTATHAAADVKATDVDAGRDTPDDSNAGRADVEYVKVRPFTAAERAEMQKHIADIQAGNYVADLADYQVEWIADAFQSELEAVDAAALIVWKILLTADEREAAMGIGVVGCYTRANDRDDYFHEAEQRARDFAGQCSDQQKRDAVTRLIESDTGATYSPGCGAFIRADLVDGLGLTECAIAHGWVRVNGGGRDFACVDGKPYVIEKTFDIYECATANKLRQERDAQSRADADARAQLERDAAVGRNVKATLKSIDERMDALRGDFADVGADAKRGADAAERAADMLADWRAWVDGGCRGRNGKSPMLNEMRQAIIDAWEKFSSGDADVELPDGTLRSKKRSRDEFYEAYANRIVYTSTADGKMWTLKQLCPKKDKLKTIIETGMRKRSRDNKPRKKKNGHRKI